MMLRQSAWLLLLSVGCALACLCAPVQAQQAGLEDELDELGDLDDQPKAEPRGSAEEERSDVVDTVDGPDTADELDDEPEAPRKADVAAFDSEESTSEAVAKAREHFEQGVEYYAEGDYRAALIELQRAYELHRTYKLLYNLGQVAYELRDYAGAERFFRDYLAKAGEQLAPERRREVQQELARLRTRVATLKLSANQPGARFRVDDRVVLHPQGSVRVSAGRRHIRASKAGFASVERVVDVTGGEEVSVSLAFGPALVATSGSGTSSAQASTSSNMWPWVTGIMAGAFAVAAGGVGYAAYQDVSERNDALDQFTPRSELDALSEQARTKAVVADALLGAAVVSAAVTVVLVLARGDRPDNAQARTPPVGASGFQARVRF